MDLALTSEFATTDFFSPSFDPQLFFSRLSTLINETSITHTNTNENQNNVNIPKLEQIQTSLTSLIDKIKIFLIECLHAEYNKFATLSSSLDTMVTKIKPVFEIAKTMISRIQVCSQLLSNDLNLVNNHISNQTMLFNDCGQLHIELLLTELFNTLTLLAPDVFQHSTSHDITQSDKNQQQIHTLSSNTTPSSYFIHPTTSPINDILEYQQSKVTDLHSFDGSFNSSFNTLLAKNNMFDLMVFQFNSNSFKSQIFTSQFPPHNPNKSSLSKHLPFSTFLLSQPHLIPHSSKLFQHYVRNQIFSFLLDEPAWYELSSSTSLFNTLETIVTTCHQINIVHSILEKKYPQSPITPTLTSVQITSLHSIYLYLATTLLNILQTNDIYQLHPTKLPNCEDSPLALNISRIINILLLPIQDPSGYSTPLDYLASAFWYILQPLADQTILNRANSHQPYPLLTPLYSTNVPPTRLDSQSFFYNNVFPQLAQNFMQSNIPSNLETENRHPLEFDTFPYFHPLRIHATYLASIEDLPPIYNDLYHTFREFVFYIIHLFEFSHPPPLQQIALLNLQQLIYTLHNLFLTHISSTTSLQTLDHLASCTKSFSDSASDHNPPNLPHLTHLYEQFSLSTLSNRLLVEIDTLLTDYASSSVKPDDTAAFSSPKSCPVPLLTNLGPTMDNIISQQRLMSQRLHHDFLIIIRKHTNHHHIGAFPTDSTKNVSQPLGNTKQPSQSTTLNNKGNTPSQNFSFFTLPKRPISIVAFLINGLSALTYSCSIPFTQTLSRNKVLDINSTLTPMHHPSSLIFTPALNILTSRRITTILYACLMTVLNLHVNLHPDSAGIMSTNYSTHNFSHILQICTFIIPSVNMVPSIHNELNAFMVHTNDLLSHHSAISSTIIHDTKRSMFPTLSGLDLAVKHPYTISYSSAMMSILISLAFNHLLASGLNSIHLQSLIGSISTNHLESATTSTPPIVPHQLSLSLASKFNPLAIFILSKSLMTLATYFTQHFVMMLSSAQTPTVYSTLNIKDLQSPQKYPNPYQFYSDAFKLYLTFLKLPYKSSSLFFTSQTPPPIDSQITSSISQVTNASPNSLLSLWGDGSNGTTTQSTLEAVSISHQHDTLNLEQLIIQSHLTWSNLLHPSQQPVSVDVVSYKRIATLFQSTIKSTLTSFDSSLASEPDPNQQSPWTQHLVSLSTPLHTHCFAYVDRTVLGMITNSPNCQSAHPQILCIPASTSFAINITTLFLIHLPDLLTGLSTTLNDLAARWIVEYTDLLFTILSMEVCNLTTIIAIMREKQIYQAAKNLSPFQDVLNHLFSLRHQLQITISPNVLPSRMLEQCNRQRE